MFHFVKFFSLFQNDPRLFLTHVGLILVMEYLESHGILISFPRTLIKVMEFERVMENDRKNKRLFGNKKGKGKQCLTIFSIILKETTCETFGFVKFQKVERATNKLQVLEKHVSISVTKLES